MRTFVLLLVALFSCDACDLETAKRREETREGRPLASAAQTDDSVKPVYPANAGEVPPLVARLCEALHGLPRKKQAECCNTTPGVLLTSECERNLTGAIQNGVVLDEARVAACEKAMKEQHATCDWIGPWQAPVPVACLGLVAGNKSAGAECRSNLECEEGLRCIGLGPTDPGVCGPPPPVGSICGAAVDTLAVYLRQDDVDRWHPACDGGFCDRSRCVPFVEPGGGCRSSVQCLGGPCLHGKCVRGDVGEGQPCSGGDCGTGLRCVAGTCQAPKSAGEPCARDDECKSACVSGTCQMRCLSPAILRGLIKTRTATLPQPKSIP